MPPPLHHVRSCYQGASQRRSRERSFRSPPSAHPCCAGPPRLTQVLGWITVATWRHCARGWGGSPPALRSPCLLVCAGTRRLTSTLERSRRGGMRSGVPRSAADPPPPALINISSSTQYSVYGCCQKPDKLIMRREGDTER